MESLIIYMPILMALIGLLYMVAKKSWVMKQDACNYLRVTQIELYYKNMDFGRSHLAILFKF